MILAAEGTITPGEHWTVQLGGLTFNVDTIIGTIVAGLIVCGLGYYMANRATHGRPSGVDRTPAANSASSSSIGRARRCCSS